MGLFKKIGKGIKNGLKFGAKSLVRKAVPGGNLLVAAFSGAKKKSSPPVLAPGHRFSNRKPASVRRVSPSSSSGMFGKVIRSSLKQAVTNVKRARKSTTQKIVEAKKAVSQGVRRITSTPQVSGGIDFGKQTNLVWLPFVIIAAFVVTVISVFGKKRKR